MAKHIFYPQGVCSQQITFELNDDGTLANVRFSGGCNGNLKAISKLLEGTTVDQIESKLLGNTCGRKSTSCADQLAKGVRLAYDGKLG